MIINEDCYNYLPTIKSNSIDLVLTDPPYVISKDSKFKIHSDKADQKLVTKYNISIDFGDWDKQQLDWSFILGQYWRIMKPGATLIIFYDIWKLGELKEIAENLNFKQPRIGQWQKTNPVPVNSGINYLSNACEYFLTFVKGKKPIFNSKYDNGVYKYPICHGQERTKHPTQKPLSLIKDLIQKHSNPGALVLDTFAGSGTTGEACFSLGRDFILVEKDERYFEIIKNRLENLSTKHNIENI